MAKNILKKFNISFANSKLTINNKVIKIPTGILNISIGGSFHVKYKKLKKHEIDK
jgi:hypothetical protein